MLTYEPMNKHKTESRVTTIKDASIASTFFEAFDLKDCPVNTSLAKIRLLPSSLSALISRLPSRISPFFARTAMQQVR